MSSVWLWRSLFAGLGAAAGFAYYYFIGCQSGGCAITGNPWISTLYGGVMGLLLHPTLRNTPTKGEHS